MYTNCANNLSLADPINLVTAILGFAALVFGLPWGVNIIRKELKLRSADAACGFLAQLKASVANLQRAAYYPGVTKCVQTSVFFSFCSENERSELGKSNDGVIFRGSRNGGEIDNLDWQRFEACAQTVLTLFETSNGQMPLSKKMFLSFGDIQMILRDMLICKKHKLQMQRHKLHCSQDFVPGPIGSKESVESERADFDMLLGCIIAEIDKKTEKLMEDLWERLNSKSDKYCSVCSRTLENGSHAT